MMFGSAAHVRGSKEKCLITPVMDVGVRTACCSPREIRLLHKTPPWSKSFEASLSLFQLSSSRPPSRLTIPPLPPKLATNPSPHPPRTLYRAGASRRQVERQEDRAAARRKMTTVLSLPHAADPAGPLQMVAIFHHAKSLIPVAWSTPISETKELHML